MDEGTVFAAYQPVLVVEGTYVEWAQYETALLGLLCQASGVATKAARCKKAAGERQVISFGARRMHPALAPMIERNAFIGGCDGVAVTKSAELIDADPMGTIPHSLVLMVGDTVEALRAFHEVIDPKVRRVALIDTLQDEKFEAVRVAEALGQDLYAVRLDTPSSRRGDFYRILEEVRWELDLRGFQHVKLVASGGVDEYEILRLNPLVDSYGVGTSLASAPGAQLRPRHHGDRGPPDGQAREVVRGQGRLSPPGLARDRRRAGRPRAPRWSGLLGPSAQAAGRAAGASCAISRLRGRSASSCSISSGWCRSTPCAGRARGRISDHDPRRHRRRQARGDRAPARRGAARRAGVALPGTRRPRATSRPR